MIGSVFIPFCRKRAQDAVGLFPFFCIVTVLGNLALSGCGGGGSSGSSPSPTAPPTTTPSTTPSPPIPTPDVSLTATKVNILRGETVRLSWNASNATRLVSSTFEASGVSGEKSVTPTTTTSYALTVEGPGGQKSASVTVNVSPVSMTVSPQAGTIPINRSLVLTAIVSGAVNTNVNWSVVESDGGRINPDINNSGRVTYTAPDHVGVYHVTVQSAADPNQRATIEIRVQASSGNVTVQ